MSYLSGKYIFVKFINTLTGNQTTKMFNTIAFQKDDENSVYLVNSENNFSVAFDPEDNNLDPIIKSVIDGISGREGFESLDLTEYLYSPYARFPIDFRKIFGGD